MPPTSALSRFAKWFGRGATKLKGIRVAKASVGSAASVASVSRGTKLAQSVSKLPVFRIIVGSAVGVAILSWWDNAKKSISDMLGIDPNTANLLLGVGILIAIVYVLSLMLRRRT